MRYNITQQTSDINHQTEYDYDHEYQKKDELHTEREAWTVLRLVTLRVQTKMARASAWTHYMHKEACRGYYDYCDCCCGMPA